MKKILLIFIITIFYSSSTKAQNVITDFLIGSSENFRNDTEKLIEGYMSPFGEWFGTGLNSGWYNTGKPHQFPGFDVTAGVHFITPPNEAMMFNPNLNTLTISNNNELSTIIGPSNNTQILYSNPITGQLEPLFDAPGGLNWDGVLVMPYLQGSIGLIKKTEILFRLAPRVDVNDLSMGFWGLGFKHDVKQWIPGVKLLPFDLSFVAGYSSLKSDLDFANPGQNLNFNVKAFNSNLVLSKKLSFFTPYIGVGYQYSKSALALNGTYTIYDWDGEQILAGESITVKDPFDFSFGGINGFKATMGARLKLFLFTLHIDWTKAQYDIFTIGIGLNSDIGSKLIGGTIDKTITD